MMAIVLVLVVSVTRVASHLARSYTPSIACIVARFPAVTPQHIPPTNGNAPRAPLAGGRRTYTRSLISGILNSP